MKTQWRKMESWRPFKVRPGQWVRVRELEDGAESVAQVFKSRAAALRAANTANRRDGLPEVE